MQSLYLFPQILIDCVDQITLRRFSYEPKREEKGIQVLYLVCFMCVCKHRKEGSLELLYVRHTLCLVCHLLLAVGCWLMRLPAASIRPGLNPWEDISVKLSSSNMASPCSYSNTQHIEIKASILVGHLWPWKGSVPEQWPSCSSESWRFFHCWTKPQTLNGPEHGKNPIK